MANMMRSTTPFSVGNLANPPSAPPPPSGGPQYADVFDWLNPNTEGAKSTWAKTGNSTDPTAGSYVQDSNGNQVFMPTQVLNVDQSQIPDKYKGLVTGGQNLNGNWNYNYDLSKLPNGGKLANGMTLDQMMSLGAGKDPRLFTPAPTGGRQNDAWYVKDPSKAFYDPNYGWVTNKMNFEHPPEQNNWMDTAGNIAWGLGMGAFGGAGALLGAAKNYGDTGDWKKAAIGAIPGVVGMGLGASGFQLPAGLQQGFNLARLGYGAYNAIQSKNPWAIGQLAAGSLMRGS